MEIRQLRSVKWRLLFESCAKLKMSGPLGNSREPEGLPLRHLVIYWKGFFNWIPELDQGWSRSQDLSGYLMIQVFLQLDSEHHCL